MSSKKKVSEATSHLRVAVRVRPMNGAERSEKCTNIVRVDKKKLTIDLKGKSFGPFFRTYDAETTQDDIYSDLVSSQIKKVIAGFNCTVFAYGQTGTGKTFTMEGGKIDAKCSQEDPSTGIIPRAVEDIFQQLEVSGCDEYSLRVSYVELYNEELFDLLASSEYEDRERLRIFDDPNRKGVIVSGVEEVPVRSRSDVFKLLQMGAEKRKTASTLMNMHSSRSHSLFMVNVVVRENTNTGEELVKQGKLNLVDLAGSENIGRSGALGNRAKEAGSINQSLLTLGRVIRSLTTNAQHVPYRESKLTRLLQDSLGGSTITSLIATLSPSSSNFEESQSTLEYAIRAANIKNKPVCNTKVSKKAILKEYSDEIEKLRRDLRAAREKNGIFISDESHEEFMKNAEKVNELEQNLNCVVDRLRVFTEDQMHMDEQYRQLYERKGQLEDRLRDRLREMAAKEKELADANDALEQHKEVIRKMHAASLDSYDMLVQAQDAADELETDIRAFWRKVDEMGYADDRNKKVVERFIAKMRSSLEDTSNQKDLFKREGNILSNQLIESMAPHVEELKLINQNITSNAEDLDSTIRNTFLEAAEEEKRVVERVNLLSAQSHERFELMVKSCNEYYKAHSVKTEEFNKNLMARLDEIKYGVADFAKDLKPLIASVRETTFDGLEKRTEQSTSYTENVKSTCSSMAEALKALLVQVNNLSVNAEENHERTLIAGQNTQETILTTLNTAENVLQQVENIIEEQCDVNEIAESTEKSLDKINIDLENMIQTEQEKAARNEIDVKNVLTDFAKMADISRDKASATTSSIVARLADVSSKCMLTSDEVAKESNEMSTKMKSLLEGHEKTMEKIISEAMESVKSVQLENVDPSANVPQRIIPAFPMSTDLKMPENPENLLGMEEDEEIDDDDNEELAKRKRRVTSFVRRDTLLDTTNIFLSPSTIKKRREQTIEEEEEDFEN